MGTALWIGDERRVLQLADRQVRDLVEAGQVQRSRHPVDGVLVDRQLPDQQAEHVGRHVLLDLEPDGRLEAALGQLALHRLQQVLGHVLVDLELTDPGDAEDVALDDVHAAEELVQVGRDHVLDRHVAVLADVDEARQRRRHLDPGEHGDAGGRVDQGDREVEREPGDERERVRGVHHQRREHRVDALPEQLGQVVCARRRSAPSSAGSRCRGRSGPA